MSAIHLPADGDERPWEVLTPSVRDQQRGAHFTEELKRELGPQHPLEGRRFRVVAIFKPAEDVLIQIDEDDWAVVHLTHRGKPSWPAEPRTRIVHGMQAAYDACMDLARSFGFFSET